jgi:hypothetical protein
MSKRYFVKSRDWSTSFKGEVLSEEEETFGPYYSDWYAEEKLQNILKDYEYTLTQAGIYFLKYVKPGIVKYDLGAFGRIFVTEADDSPEYSYDYDRITCDI